MAILSEQNRIHAMPDHWLTLRRAFRAPVTSTTPSVVSSSASSTLPEGGCRVITVVMMTTKRG